MLQFLQVSVNDDPPETTLGAYAPIPGPATEEGKEEQLSTGLLGDAGGVSIGEDRDDEEFEEIPRAVYGRGVEVCDTINPLPLSSVPSSPARCRNSGLG